MNDIASSPKPADPLPRAARTGGAVVVDRCQVCGDRNLESVLFLGYLPVVNAPTAMGERAKPPAHPAELLHCPKCHLVQLGLIVDPAVLFPADRSYTSGAAPRRREDFAELAREAKARLGLDRDDLVVDVGADDGTLLGNFVSGHRVLGIEPTRAARLCENRGMETINAFFTKAVVDEVLSLRGPATLVVAGSVFAQLEGVHEVVENVRALMAPNGVFLVESHDLLALVETLQYDAFRHEQLRYYSLHALRYLLEAHGLEIFWARRVPADGGSLRVWAAAPGTRPVDPAVAALLAAEVEAGLLGDRLARFRREVVLAKLKLVELLAAAKRGGGRVYGIGASSRAGTLIHYTGLQDVLDAVLEVQGSSRIGTCMPGTIIPVVDEARLIEDQPEYAMLLSWPPAEELIPRLKAQGYRGQYVTPFPEPRVVAG
jgi:hypothetical protein